MASPAKDKKAKVTEGGSPKASADLVQSMGKLQDIQDELRQIDESENEEHLALEMKYNELRKPVFATRNQVIESIHEFWLIVFLSHPTLGNLLSKEDEKILKYMVSLEVEEDMNSDYSIIFNFAPNPYFDDTKLTKTYCFDEVENLSISCESIKWKEGKGDTNNSGSGKGAKRPYPYESFFTWFSKEVRSDGQVDEIAEIIKDDLWPNPLKHLQKEVDAMGLDQEGEGEEVTGGGNQSMDEDEDDDKGEGGDDNDEYHEEDGDDEEEDDHMDKDDGDTDDSADD